VLAARAIGAGRLVGNAEELLLVVLHLENYSVDVRAAFMSAGRRATYLFGRSDN
jgi:hypothetical protein